jgi:hypothetical protein
LISVSESSVIIFPPKEDYNDISYMTIGNQIEENPALGCLHPFSHESHATKWIPLRND